MCPWVMGERGKRIWAHIQSYLPVWGIDCQAQQSLLDLRVQDLDKVWRASSVLVVICLPRMFLHERLDVNGLPPPSTASVSAPTARHERTELTSRKPKFTNREGFPSVSSNTSSK